MSTLRATVAERLGLLYAAWSAAVVLVCFLLVRSAAFAAKPAVLSVAVTLDLVVVLPALYLLVARQKGWPRISAVPVFLLALFAAHAVLPADQQSLLRLLGFAAIPLELFVLGFVAREARQIARGFRGARTGADDFVEALESVLVQSLGWLPPRAVQLVLTEATVLYYGFAAWTGAPLAPAGGQTFPYHRRSGYGAVVGVFAFLILFETTLVHLLLARWSAPLAWVLTVASIYGAVFLFADYKAARLRPLLLTEDTLYVRTGLRWRVDIRREDIVRIEVTGSDRRGGKGLFRASLLPGHNLVLELGRPYRVRGLYGLTREAERIALAVDDVQGFAAALRGGMGLPPPRRPAD